MLDQFDRLRKRNAFLEQYKKEKMLRTVWRSSMMRGMYDL